MSEDFHWADQPKPTTVQMQEDTAGRRWFSEFEPGSTAPIRTWQEPPSDVEVVTPAMVRFVYAGLLVLLMLLAGCGPACKLQAQRCSGGIAQLCGTDGQWRDVLDCSTMQTHRTCGCEGEPSKCRCRRAP